MQTDERIFIQHIVMGKLPPPQEEEMKSDSAFRQKKNHIRFKTWTRDTKILKSLKTEKLCNNSRGNSFTDVTPRTETTKPATSPWEGGRQNGFCSTDEITNCTAKPRKEKDSSDKELIYKTCKGPVQFSSFKKKWLQNGIMTPRDSFPETKHLQPTSTWEAILRTLKNCK